MKPFLSEQAAWPRWASLLSTAALSSLLVASATSPARAVPIGPACPADAIAIPLGGDMASIVAGAPAGARFCIKAGIHRMQTAEPKDGQEFYGEPGAVLSGARILDDFSRSGAVWVANGQTQSAVDRGVCAEGYETCKQPIGFFIDDKPLRQIGSEADLRPGAFVYDHAKGEIRFLDSPIGRKVEATVTRFAIAGAASHVRITGLTVEKYYNPPQDGAVRGDGPGWTVDHCEMRLNSGTGVTVDADGTISNSNLHDNGQMGASANGTNIQLFDNEISNNNLYGFDPSWDAGGVKVTVASEVVFRGNHVFGNKGPGLWCDERCFDVLFEDNRVEENDGAGIFFELSSKAVIRNNDLRENNQAGSGWYWGSEIQIAASEYADIYRNRLIVRAPGRGIMLIDQNRWKVGGGFYKTQGNLVHDNEITYLGEGASGGVSSGNPLDVNFGIIQGGGNRFDANIYRYSGAKAPNFAWDLLVADFAGFRQLGQERNGSLMFTEDAPEAQTR